MNQADANMKMMELQMMQQQMEQLNQQKQQIDMKKAEVETTLAALKGITENKSQELMIPLGSGVFIPGKVEDTKHVIYAIGSKTAVKNTVANAETYIQKQMKLVLEAEMEVTKQGLELQTKAQGMIAELEAAQTEMQGHSHDHDHEGHDHSHHDHDHKH